MPEGSEQILMVGCGDLGARIGVGLLAAGNRVLALTRRRLPPAGVVALHGDVTDAASLPQLPASIDRLVYVMTPSARTEAAYQLAYVTGLRNVLAALAPDCRPSVTLISSTAVYADAQGDLVDEATPARSETFNGRAMLAAEQLAMTAHAGSLLLRLGGIYGHGHDLVLQDALAASRSAPSPVVSNRIHIDDAAAAVCHLIHGGHRGVFNIVDSEPASRAQVLAWMAMEQSGSELAPVPAPPQGRRISNQRLLASGFGLRYPSWREGYRASPMAL